MISTLGGKIASNQIIRLVPIKLSSIVVNTDLILLPLEGLDVILGMNWMVQHGVVSYIPSRAVELNSPKYGATTLYLPFRECTNSCAFAMSESKLEEIPVVCEYADVFPDDLPGMPPDRCWGLDLREYTRRLIPASKTSPNPSAGPRCWVT